VGHEVVHASFSWEPGAIAADTTPSRRGLKPTISETIPRDLLMLPEAAAYLNITPEQIRAHVADGALRFVNVAALSLSARRP
jgi:hypothetical protein